MSETSRRPESSESGSRGRRPSRWWLVALALAIALARLHTYHEPLPRDLTTYALIGHGLLDGRHLYADLWDHKPPAIHVVYAAAELALGFGEAPVYALSVLAAVLTLFGVYSLAARAGPAIGRWAALFWALVCLDMGLEGNEPNAEAFINLSLVWAMALLAARPERAPPPPRRALAAGALFALASLFKPVVVVTPGLLVGLWLAHAGRDRASLRASIASGGALAAPGVVAWCAVFGYFAAVGRFEPFYDAVFVYNRHYAGDMVSNLLTAWWPSRLAPSRLWFVAPLAALAFVGLALDARRSSLAKRWGMWLAWALGTLVAVAWPGMDHSHYYQLWLPVLAVGGAWGIAALRAALPPRWRVVPAAAGAGVALLLFAHEAPSYRIPGELWSAHKFGPVFVVSKREAREIDALLEPGETFFHWGSQTGLYFYSGRPVPSGIFYMFAVKQGPLVEKLTRRLLADLERARPVLVVWSGPFPPRSGRRTAVQEWIEARYRLMPGQPNRGPFLRLARRGGRLDSESAVEGTPGG